MILNLFHTFKKDKPTSILLQSTSNRVHPVTNSSQWILFISMNRKVLNVEEEDSNPIVMPLWLRVNLVTVVSF